MMSLFDEEQIMKSFIKSERHDEARETAERMIKGTWSRGHAVGVINHINQNQI